MIDEKFPTPEWIYHRAAELVSSFGLDWGDDDLVRIAKTHIEAAFRDLVINRGNSDDAMPRLRAEKVEAAQ